MNEIWGTDKPQQVRNWAMKIFVPGRLRHELAVNLFASPAQRGGSNCWPPLPIYRVYICFQSKMNGDRVTERAGRQHVSLPRIPGLDLTSPVIQCMEYNIRGPVAFPAAYQV